MSSSTTEFASTTSSVDDLILRLNAVDIAVIAVFFALVLGVGIWSMIQANRSSVQGYFLAGKSMIWWPVGLSIFASNISSNSFIGLAGSGADSGVAVGFYELSGLYCVLLAAWVFIPVYMASGIYTMPEYMKYRFGGQRIRIYLSCLSLILYIFTKISIDLYSGAIFIQQSLGWELYPSILSLLAITALFAITGGLTAVIYTDAFDSIIMVGGGIVLMILAFIEIGGYNGLVEAWPLAVPADANGSCGIPNDNAFNIFRSLDDPNYPWTGTLFGCTILGVWYWCTDQVIIQRSLSAKGLLHAKAGSVLAAALKILPLFLMVFPGMISRALFPDEVACVTPEVCERVCQNAAGCSNIAYPKLVIEVMPQGLRGLMIAAILAALMSSLTSVFNSTATIFTIDIWKRIRKEAGEREMTIVGRLFVLILTIVSVAWIPILTNLQGGKLFEYIQSITSYLSPPICATYLLSLLWSRMNEPGAFWGLLCGLVMGVIRMLLDFTISSQGCGYPDPRPYITSKVAFLNFACILFVLSMVVSVIISLLTPPVEKFRLPSLTWWTRFQKPKCYDMLAAKKKFNKQKDIVIANPATGFNAEDTESQNSYESITIVRKQTSKERILDLCCGSNALAEDSTDEGKRAEHLGREAIKEDPKWGTFVNAACIVVVAIDVYVSAYFG